MEHINGHVTMGATSLLVIQLTEPIITEPTELITEPTELITEPMELITEPTELINFQYL